MSHIQTDAKQRKSIGQSTWNRIWWLQCVLHKQIHIAVLEWVRKSFNLSPIAGKSTVCRIISCGWQQSKQQSPTKATDSPHKRPVQQKTFPWHVAFMTTGTASYPTGVCLLISTSYHVDKHFKKAEGPHDERFLQWINAVGRGRIVGEVVFFSTIMLDDVNILVHVC